MLSGHTGFESDAVRLGALIAMYLLDEVQSSFSLSAVSRSFALPSPALPFLPTPPQRSAHENQTMGRSAPYFLFTRVKSQNFVVGNPTT